MSSIWRFMVGFESSICLLDTSIFCVILDVQNRNQDRATVFHDFRTLIQNKASLLLPLAAIYETGNHIGQIPDGGRRWQAAQGFVEQVEACLGGKAPWTPTPFPETEILRTWLAEFPNCASRGMGWGDLSIVKEWERQKHLNPSRRVFIWTTDRHLSSYDTGRITSF